MLFGFLALTFSEMISMHPYDTLPLLNGAHLILTPCPGTKGVSTEQSVADLKAGGADALVTMMPEADLKRFGVADIPQACELQGMAWFHLPVEDDEAPEAPFFEAFERYAKTLDDLLFSGKTLALHCKGGTGRTSLIAAILMHRQGYSWDELKTKIQAVRPTGLSIPAHVTFLQDYFKRSK